MWSMTERINKLEPESERLRGIVHDYSSIRRVLGSERVNMSLSVQ